MHRHNNSSSGGAAINQIAGASAVLREARDWLQFEQVTMASKRHKRLSAAKPQPNGVRPSSGAETSDGNTCGSTPEPQTSLKLLRPGTAALRKFIASCEQFPRLQRKPVRFLSHSQRNSSRNAAISGTATW